MNTHTLIVLAQTAEPTFTLQTLVYTVVISVGVSVGALVGVGRLVLAWWPSLLGVIVPKKKDHGRIRALIPVESPLPCGPCHAGDEIKRVWEVLSQLVEINTVTSNNVGKLVEALDLDRHDRQKAVDDATLSLARRHREG